MGEPSSAAVLDRFWVVSAVILIAIAIRLPVLDLPLERDEGAYATIAQAMLRGAVPYRDLFDHKPPGVFVAYAAAFVTIGSTPFAVRLLGCAAAALTCWGLVILGRRRRAPDRGVAAAALYGVASALPSYNGGTTNTEMLLAAPLVWGLAAAEGNGRWSAAAAGLLLGCTLLLKPTAAPIVAFALVYNGVIRASDIGWKRAAQWLAMAGSGTLLPLLVTVGFFAFVGAWPDFVECVLSYNLRYAASASASAGVESIAAGLYDFITGDPLLWMLVPVGLAIVTFVGPARERAFTWAFVASALLAVGVGFLYSHYVQTALPALAWTAAAPVSLLRRFPAMARAGYRVAAISGLVLVPVSTALAVNSAYFFGSSAAQRMRYMYGQEPYAEAVDLSRAVGAHSLPGDPVAVIGSEPEIYFLSQRPPASRYLYTYPLAPAFDTDGSARKRFIADLERVSPRVIVTVWSSTSIGLDPDEAPEFFEELSRVLAEYELVAAGDLGEPLRAPVADDSEPAALGVWRRRSR